jgi:hypothetical protein
VVVEVGQTSVMEKVKRVVRKRNVDLRFLGGWMAFEGDISFWGLWSVYREIELL